MNLLKRWLDEKQWLKTTFEQEEDFIRSFYPNLEAVKKDLKKGKIIPASIAIFKLDQ